MFTGIVQGTAQVVKITKTTNSRTHTLKIPQPRSQDLKIGASVAHNGVCLTVTHIDGDLVSFDLMEETLRLTNLSLVQEGGWVNIERAMQMGDEIGGHILSGHVFTMAEVSDVIITENNRTIYFQMPKLEMMKYILPKGFIAIDGISLTIGEVKEDKFCVHLIPETLNRTILSQRKIGSKVNIEIDSQTQAIVDTTERYLTSYLKNLKISV